MSKNKILIIGGSGFIGAKLAEKLATTDFTVAYTYSSQAVNLKLKNYHINLLDDSLSLLKCLDEFKPDIIIHCAIPKSNDKDVHYKVSVQSVDHISQAVDTSTKVIYFSTNAVFNGHGPHKEESQPQIRQDHFSVYGAKRAQGERFLIENCKNSVVIRTDTVNGFDLNGVLNPRLREVVYALQNGQSVSRFIDRFVTPTLVDNLIDATLEICCEDFIYRGILHIAGSERVTDYHYVQMLARHLQISKNLIQSQTMDNPTWAVSPRDNSLDVSKAQGILKTPLLNVQEQFFHLFPPVQ